MSSPSIHNESAPTPAGDQPTQSDRLSENDQHRLTAVTRPVRFLGFWAAIVLPFLHVPLLATGLSTSSKTAVFLTLLAANVVALLVGHPYNAD